MYKVISKFTKPAQASSPLAYGDTAIEEAKKTITYWPGATIRISPNSFTHLEQSLQWLFDPATETHRKRPIDYYFHCGEGTLTAVPSHMQASKYLNRIALYQAELPVGFEKIRAVKILELSCLDDIRAALDKIKQLPSVVYLDLYKNKDIILFPSNIGKLPRLECLKISTMQNLRELPSEIGNLRRLQRLEICHTGLRRLPTEIGRLSNLRDLWLWKNPIETLPDSICELKNLKSIRLTDAAVHQLPQKLGEMKALEGVELSDYNLLMLMLDPVQREILKTLPRISIDLQNRNTIALGLVKRIVNRHKCLPNIRAQAVVFGNLFSDSWSDTAYYAFPGRELAQRHERALCSGSELFAVYQQIAKVGGGERADATFAVLKGYLDKREWQAFVCTRDNNQVAKMLAVNSAPKLR